MAFRFQHDTWNSIALLGDFCECPCLSETVGDLDSDFSPPVITARVGPGKIIADRTRTPTETSNLNTFWRHQVPDAQHIMGTNLFTGVHAVYPHTKAENYIYP